MKYYSIMKRDAIPSSDIHGRLSKLTNRFNIFCPRDCVSRHNGGTAGAPLKPLRVDSALSIRYNFRAFSISDVLPTSL